MAEDLRLFLQTAAARLAARPCGAIKHPARIDPGIALRLPATSRQSDSDQRPIKIVPKRAAIVRRA